MLVVYVLGRWCKGCRQWIDIALFRYDSPDQCNPELGVKVAVGKLAKVQGVCVCVPLLIEYCVHVLNSYVMLFAVSRFQGKKSGGERLWLMTINSSTS